MASKKDSLKKLRPNHELSIWTKLQDAYDANSLLMNRFKIQCNKFSGTISKGLGVVKKRLVREMVFGIQASKDVKLFNTGRSLKEEIPLIKPRTGLAGTCPLKTFLNI